MSLLAAALIEGGVAALSATAFARMSQATSRPELSTWWRATLLMAAAATLTLAGALVANDRLIALALVIKLLACFGFLRGLWQHQRSRALPRVPAIAALMIIATTAMIILARPEIAALAVGVAGAGLALGALAPLFELGIEGRFRAHEIGLLAASAALIGGCAAQLVGASGPGLTLATLGWLCLLIALLSEAAGTHAEEVTRLTGRLGLAQERLRNLTDGDPVTSLATRRLLRPELERLRGTPTALLLFRIDDLAAINRRYGLEAGDVCLRTLAFSCSQAFRADDGLFRFDGASILALAPSLDERLARQRVVAIKKLVKRHEPSFHVDARLTLMSADEIPARALGRLSGGSPVG